jgi:S1-C subfamily serine protease
MEQARRDLEAAAREVSRLSGGGARPVFRDFTLAFPPPRAMLGLTLDTSDAPNGARVLGVSPGGAAAEAGVVAGDVITAIDGVELAGGDSARARLVEYMARVEPGKAVVLDVSRDGEAREITVEARGTNFTFATNALRAVPATPGAAASGAVQLGDNGYAVWSGTGPNIYRFGQFLGARWNDIELMPLSAELGRYFGTSEGLLVVRAPKDDAIGLVDGDVILDIGGREPTTPEHAMRILMSFEPGETLQFAIMRQQRRQTLEYAIPED